MADLETQRGELQRKILDLDLQDGEDRGKDIGIEAIKANWPEAKRLIGNWWDAYKEWETLDTFNVAVAERRMTMRSFGPEFDYQVSKTIPMNIAEDSRFYANSARQKVADPTTHRRAFNTAVTSGHYAKPFRGIDTAPFANPKNFQTREEKYKHGLHDLSVKLLIPGGQWYDQAKIQKPQNVGNPENLGFKAQSHHSGTPEGEKPHFCFLPISKPEDQYVIYKLVQYAKALGPTIPDLDTLIRKYRSKMTRVKLAHHYDMATGYIAVATPDRDGDLPYKVSFSVGNIAKKRKEEGGGIVFVSTSILKARKQAYFRHNASVLKIGNEIVIAMRRHLGPFPVYAYYDAGIFRCYDIKGGRPEPNGKTISALGVASW